MNHASGKRKYRLLIVDDNRAIHEDFRKILAPDTGLEQLGAYEAELFGHTIEVTRRNDFDIDSAYQGAQGLELVRAALEEGRPYALAFVDMRMPPGWNGIETIERIWQIDPELQVVICSAYSDHSWAEISKRLDNSDRLLILKKPFDNVEILQMAYAMSRKCALARAERQLPEAGDGAAPADGAELIAAAGQVRDNVNALREAFNTLKSRLKNARATADNSVEPTAAQVLENLPGAAEIERIESLETRLPEALNRLDAALEGVGIDTGTTRRDNRE